MQCIRGDGGGKMAALVLYLLFLFTAVFAQDDEDYDNTNIVEVAPYFAIEAPKPGAEVNRELFFVDWNGTDEYYGEITIELHPTDPSDNLNEVFSTAFPNTYTNTYLDGDYLPTLTAAETTTLELWVYAIDATIGTWGMYETVAMYDTRAATVTSTTTLTPTATSTTSTTSTTDTSITAIHTTPPHDEAISESESENETETERSGLSTGAKAGIGVGSAVGALLLLAAAFFFFRRWQKGRQTPRTIREISAGENPSSSLTFINGLPSESGTGSQAEAFGHGSVISAPSENGDKGFRPVSLPVVVSPIEEDRSVSGRRSGERFELGG